MKKIYFKDKELYSLSQLLKANIPFKEALSLIQNRGNEKAIIKILEELKTGKYVEEILFDYLRKDTKDILKSFLKIVSFERALYLSLEFMNHKKRTKEKLQKELAYPLLLFAIGMIGLSLFEKIALPSLFGMLENFEVDYRFVVMISQGISLLIQGVLWFIVLFLILFLFFQKRRRKRLLYRLLKRLQTRSYFELYYNYEFVYFYDLCSQEGISTKDTLSLIRSFRQDPILSYFAYEIDEILNTGKSFEEAILASSLDPHFYIYMKIAVYSGNLKGMMKLYLEENEKERHQKIERLVKSMQLLSYGMIGLFVIFIYQILFLPMQALNQF